MGTHMKTTIEIADPLLKEARELARREGTTLKALVEEGLKAVLGRRPPGKPFVMRDGSYGGSGLTPEFEAKGGWDKLREAAYPGFFDDDDEDK
jgi:hypothetical protein